MVPLIPQKMVAVTVPPGATPGTIVQVEACDPATGARSLVQATVPADCPPGGTFHVAFGGPTVVTAQPTAAQPTAAAIQAKVHGLLRDGLRPVAVDDAWAYVRSLTPAQAHVRNHGGCHVCQPVTCCGCPGCVCTYNFAMGDGCLCPSAGVPFFFSRSVVTARARAGFPCCTLGVCLPVYSCLCCTCERKDNAWITRDKHGMMTGAIMLLDHERGTLAMYGVKCCTQTFEEHPQCYCTKYPGAG